MKQVKWLFLLFPLAGIAQNLDEARLEFNRYEYERSAQLFTAVQAEKKLKTEDLKMLTYANYVSGSWEKCLENVNALIEEKSADPMHYLMRADALKALKRYPEATEAYKVYQTKDPNDYVDVDLQSCTYLPTIEPLSGIRIEKEASNTKKADLRYFDSGLGVVYFHEIGADSVRNKMSYDKADLAELLLLRPFSSVNGSMEMYRFPEKFDYYSVSSISKDPNSNRVIFTAYGLLDKHGIYRSPQLYVGNLLSDKLTIEDISLWQYAHPEQGESSAFASFVPGESTIVYSVLKKDSKTYSDLYWSSFSNNTWSSPLEVGQVNTSGEEEYIQFKEGKVYFSSTGRPGYGALDVYEGVYDNSNHAIMSIQHLVEPINSASDDLYYFGNLDTTFITSNRFGSNAEDDVWQFINEKQIAEKAADLARQQAIADSLEVQAILSWIPPKIYYDFDTDNPNSDYSFLHKLAEVLQENPGIDVEVVGYTDVRGTDEYNMYLSYDRAKFVKTQLVEKGIPENRILIKGKGKVLANENSDAKSSEEVHQENRFVLITLIKAD